MYRWDEWVDESRVLKYNEANLEKHKQMIKTLQKQKPAIKRAINDVCLEGSNRKRKREPTESTTEEVSSTLNLSILL